MLFLDWLKPDTRTNAYKHILLPFVVILAGITLTIISNNTVLTIGNILISLLLIGGVFFIAIFLYFPVLIVMRFIRGERSFESLVLRCLSILLWSFIPLALLWIGASIINLTFYKLPWSVFSNIFFWGKSIIIPLSLFYFYENFYKQNFYNSLIDAMLVAGVVMLLPLINW